MQKKILDFIHKNNLFDKKKIMIAVSGGADSMSLLHFLMSIKERENLEIAALHFEHGIRGVESKEDAIFVENYCKQNDIPLFMGEGDVPKYAAENKLTLEMAARTLRYNFFDKILQSENFDVIATAHHADDQAETVLLNLLRGSGIKGLAAMRPKKGNIIRPFLTVTKAEILEYAKKHNIEFREDSTNNSVLYRRNRIRHELLPILKTYQSAISEHLTILAEIAGVESDYLDTLAKEKLFLLKKANLEAFKQEPLALQRRIITVFLDENQILTDFTHIEEIRKILLKGMLGKHIEISKEIFAELSYNGLQIIRKNDKDIPSVKLKVPGLNILEDFKIKIITKLIDKIPQRTFPNEYYADFDKLSDDIAVRGRIDGDFIKLKFGKKSIKKIFMEEKIERSRRSIYPIIFCGSQVLWIPNLRRSVLYRPNKDTKHILYMKVEEI